MQYINEHHAYEGCVFCAAAHLEDSFENLIIKRGKHAFIILNRFPYNNAHLLVVPFNHCDALEMLEKQTHNEIMALASESIRILKVLYSPQGFNLGFNIGTVAGAGIAEHLHMHIIPRWGGDTNFMSTIGKTRVLPEELTATYTNLRKAWQAEGLL